MLFKGHYFYMVPLNLTNKIKLSPLGACSSDFNYPSTLHPFLLLPPLSLLLSPKTDKTYI